MAAQHTSAQRILPNWLPGVLRKNQQNIAGNGDVIFLGGNLTMYTPQFLNMHMLWYIYVN